MAMVKKYKQNYLVVCSADHNTLIQGWPQRSWEATYGS